MAHWQNEDTDAETHALGHRGDPGEREDRLVDRQRAGALSAEEGNVLADPDVGEPQRLGLLGKAADHGGSGAFAGVGDVDAEVHSCRSFWDLRVTLSRTTTPSSSGHSDCVAIMTESGNPKT
jgi:hypothetical protein